MGRGWRQTSGGRWVRDYPLPPPRHPFRCDRCHLEVQVPLDRDMAPTTQRCPDGTCGGTLRPMTEEGRRG